MKLPPQIRTDEPALQTEQRAPSPHLAALVDKHQSTAWRKPVPSHTRRAADEALAWLKSIGNPPLILDSFCGTGMSTQWLAERFDTCAVIGLDKSMARLDKHQRGGGTYRLIRAECEPFWSCLVDAGIRLEKHWLLYPNPWPKGTQLKRRIHGHPGFPLLRSLGGDLELRSNWQVYVDEFHLACELLGMEGEKGVLEVDVPITLFERKYHERGQTLWQFKAAR